SGRYRGSLRQRGARRLDRALHADGDDQPQPRAAEPDADSRARRRPHLHPRARRARAARLQPEGEREDAARRVRPAADADDDGHLQRSDAHPMDRKAGALALVALLSVFILLPHAQDPDPAGTGTFSILGYDPATGELGAAVQSRVFSAGNGVLWGEANVGIVATQAIRDVSYGPQALALLRQGVAPQAVVSAVWKRAPDPRPEDWTKYGRQFAVMDARGRVAAYTGP